MSEWYIEHAGKTHGPIDNETLKKLASNGKIRPDTPLRQGTGGEWTKCGKVKGLFMGLSNSSQSIAVASQPEVERLPQTITAPVVSEKSCPFCGESIALVAVKCKHCGEFLDAKLRSASSQPPKPSIVMQPQSVVHVVNNVSTSGPRWSRILAAFLSFLIPGLGQMYKGQLFNGLIWLVVVVIGYVCFIVPGIVLHFCCIAGAAMGNPSR
jgi:TM2 domain-containing membrane protein YozV